MRKLYIILDIDWACDEVLEDTYSLIKKYDISATMNVTHNTKWISCFRRDDKIELGIHPNFKETTEAVTVRSHSLTTSSLILTDFIRNRLLYELNT